MNKSQFVSAIAEKAQISKADSEKCVNAFIDVVKDSLKKNDKILLVGFGTFSVQDRKATTGVNPQTKAKINIPAKKVAKLKFSDQINKELND